MAIAVGIVIGKVIIKSIVAATTSKACFNLALILLCKILNPEVNANQSS